MTAGARQVADCCLTWGETAWPYAERNASAINAHWQAQIADNPNYFNGWVHVLSSWSVDDRNVFHGQFFRTDFRSYLYWRHRGFEESGALDGFGSALIVSRDNQVMLGEQASGHVNTGLVDCIGGFIDERDCLTDGRLVIDASIVREVKEETGLQDTELERRPGYWIAESQKQISIAIVFQARQKAADLTQRIASFLATEDKPELDSVRFVSAASLSTETRIPDYARSLIQSVTDNNAGMPKGASGC